MESLLGTSLDDPRTMAVMSAVQGLLGGRGALQGISNGLMAYGGTMQAAKQQQAAEELRKMQLAQHALQLKQMQEAAAQQELDKRLTQAALSPIRGIEANRASGITGPRPEALGVVGQVPTFDPHQFVSKGGSLQGAAAVAQLLAKERAKIKDYKEVRMPDGSVQIVGFDEYGKPVDTGRTPFKDGDVQDFGGAKYVRDPVTNKLTLLGNKTMTPGEIASIALGRDRLNFDKSESNRAVTWQQDSEGNYFALPTKLGGNASPRAIPALGPNGVPIQGKGAGMTEDQGKATGWLVQAANAFENMKKAGFDKEGKPTSAAYPGFNDALEKVPGMGWAANSFRSKDRQAFMQASSSLSEALLRAATGAGINQDEAAQKVRELTPLFGEDEAVTKQKMAAIPLYIESLKVRAGPGSKKAAAIGPGDPLGMFGNSGADPTDPWGLRSILQQKQP